MKLALFSIFLLSFFVIYGHTNPDADAVIYLHNIVRADVSPTASNMIALEWSDCLASVASDYLDSCPGFRHNRERTNAAKDKGCVKNTWSAYVGENLFYASYI